MTKVCTICGNDQRLEMEREYIKGKSVNSISKKYGVSYEALNNHVKNHLSYQLTSQWEKKLSQQNSDLLNELEDILQKAKSIFDRNYDKGRDRIALESLNSQRNAIQLLAQITVKMHEVKTMEIEQQEKQVDEKSGDKFWSKVEKNLNQAEAELLKQLFVKLSTGENQTFVKKDKSSGQFVVQNINIFPEPQTKFKRKRRKKSNNVGNNVEEHTEDENREDFGDCREDEYKVRPIESEEIGYTRFIDHPDVRRD